MRFLQNLYISGCDENTNGAKMNYLAHLALSENHESIMVGNFIADFVKGKKYKQYPEEIQKGIILHRKIDYYTDTDDIIGEGIQLIGEKHGKFSGILMDMFLDYFLAQHFKTIYQTSVADFQEQSFMILDQNQSYFPEHVTLMYKYMKKGTWLERYQTTEGLYQSLEGLSKRIKYENNINEGIETLLTYEQSLNQIFLRFYPKIQAFCSSYLQENLVK